MVLPTDVLYRKAERRLSIQWENGERSDFDAEYLRGWCPCAQCQGHGAETVFHSPRSADTQNRGQNSGSDVEDRGLAIDSMWEVGAYAIGIRFSDGHQEGIFRWSFLEQISAHTEPRGLKYGRFVHGIYFPPKAKPAGRS